MSGQGEVDAMERGGSAESGGRWRAASLVGRAALLAGAAGAVACGDEAPPVPAEVVVTPASATAETVGATVQYAARVVDAEGAAIPGAPVTWSSGNREVGTVSATGLATVVGQGTAVIRAVHETVSGTASLVVQLRPASMAKVAGDSLTAPAASVLPEQPTVRVADAGGAPVPGVAVRFEVVSGGGRITPRSALTDSDGEASTRWTLGHFQGVQVLRATSDEFQADFVATATEVLLAVGTARLERARLSLDYWATLEAIGGTSPYAWSLADGGLPAGLALGEDGTISGTPEGLGSSTFSVLVRDASGLEARKDLAMVVCEAPLALEPGGVHATSPVAAASDCPPFIPAGGAGDLYRVGLVRTGFSQDLTFADVALRVVEITGRPTPGAHDELAQSATSGATLVPLPRPAPRLLPSLEEAARRADATARLHARLHEDAARLLSRFGSDAVLPDLRRADPARHDAAAQLRPPPERLVFLPYDADRNDRCSPPAPTSAAALLVGYNAHLAVYQDSAQRAEEPIAEADVGQVLDYYDAYGAGTIDDYFGSVQDINGDGRVVVFVSPVVGDENAAFVWLGDFLEATECASSNEMELVYFNADQFHAVGAAPDNGHYQAMPTMVHEVKHVVSLYHRLRAGSFHPTWIEEGTAEIAAEISSRRAMAATGGVPVGAVLTRDAYPPRSGSVITPENFGVLLRLARTVRSYTQEYNSLTTNPTDDHSYYGTSWHFHRFLGDAYGGAADLAEGVFFASLNDSLASAGAGGINSATNSTMPALITEYATAMMLNGTTAPQPVRSFATYDFPSATSDLFRPPGQPAGRYPWPVLGPAPAPFESSSYRAGLAPAGIRIHEFESDGRGNGIEVEVRATGGVVRVVVARVR